MEKRRHLVTWERVAKGDLEYTLDAANYINQAHVKDNSILAYLIGESILDHHHLAAAATYSLWQYAFKKPFFCEPRKLYLIEILGCPQHAGHSEASYRKLLRKITLTDMRIVEKAITRDATGREAKASVYHLRHLFLGSFDHLIRIVKAVDDEMAAIREENTCA